MKYFTNDECLKAHIRSCHQHVNCEICGSKHLKKNIKRHLRTHDEDSAPGVFKCEVEGCSSTFSKVMKDPELLKLLSLILFNIPDHTTMIPQPSNLQKHMKAVHEDIRPFICGFPGCGMRFAYKHVRNNHENSGSHVYTCVSSCPPYLLQTQKNIESHRKSIDGFRVILLQPMKISLRDQEVD